MTIRRKASVKADMAQPEANSMVKFVNPVLEADYSDPDIIRVGKDFYMVVSSFSYYPGVPIYHSSDLVHWELINYVLKDFPLRFHNRVYPGQGAWAPSIRFHGDKYYVMIPFPDEGIFVTEASDPYGEWSPLRPLLEGKGYEDPCPIWKDGKAYVVFAFVKSRIGFNSMLAVFEADEGLEKRTSEFKYIYDGHNTNPNIEGPKFYYKDGWFYILAPAGGFIDGWQEALRSKDIYGPYEEKTI